jgi:hypothetical protein
MSDSSADDSAKEAIEEHEDLDADTVVEDAEELFEPDNTAVPPPQPDAPPPD